jgi:PDZ domain-containing secreted protein
MTKVINIEITGMDEIVGNLQRWIQIAPDKVAAAIKDEMINLMEESQKECPYDDLNPHGKYDNDYHLRDTAAVAQETDGTIITTYGSYDKEYAIYVHEILEYHHQPPTKAKFLEDPVNRREPFWLKNIVERMGDFYSEVHQ